jgi:hypothetical protein
MFRSFRIGQNHHIDPSKSALRNLFISYPKSSVCYEIIHIMAILQRFIKSCQLRTSPGMKIAHSIPPCRCTDLQLFKSITFSGAGGDFLRTVSQTVNQSFFSAENELAAGEEVSKRPALVFRPKLEPGPLRLN